jgi:hypothetical protein
MTSVNIFGPGHYGTTGETATRPTPIATSKPFDAWFAQCNPDGSGGTAIDEMWLNGLIAALRQLVRTASAAEAELDEKMLAEAAARIASGGVFGVESSSGANAYNLVASDNFQPPKAYFKGMRILWYAVAGTTSNSTVNAFGIGVKKLLRPDASQTVQGSVQAGLLTEAIYDPALDSGAGAFKIAPWAANSGKLSRILYVSSATNINFAANEFMADVEMWGAGGGGGGTSAVTGAGAAGGGAGEYRRGLFKNLNGSSITVTPGSGGNGGAAGGANNGSTGGDTTFGALMRAKGGKGGQGVASGTNALVGDGGTGGANGDSHWDGGWGETTIAGFGGAYWQGPGGAPWGQAEGHLQSTPGTTTSDGYDGLKAGQGGNGGLAGGKGGNGGPGFAIVRIYS